MVIDVTTFNGEHELFDLRYNILKDYVDEFIVVEFDKTFSGKPKEQTFTFQDLPKVKYFFVTEEIYSKYRELAESSPNTIGADHWKTEFMQKESIKDCLTHLKDNDIVFIGDCDEIWNPSVWIFPDDLADEPIKLRLNVYSYYLNNKSSELFFGTLLCRYKDVKNACLNHLRTIDTVGNHTNLGWHFTSMHHQLERKLTDSYTADSYASPQVMAQLQENIDKSKDFLGRGFTYRIDESELPKYLLENKKKYAHLFK